MARRRDPVQFDLVPDEDGPGDAGTSAAAGSAGEPVEPGWFGRRVAGPVRERWRATPRRLRAGIVGVTAVAVVGTAAGVAALDARSDAAHAEHMAEMPGGVADLSVPLEETWRVETDEGVVAVLPGGVVVTRDGTDVLGVDVATGDEVWRHELGALVECGPDNLRGLLSTGIEALVCVHGTPERTATVLDASGTVLGDRELGVANHGQRGAWVDGAPQVLPAGDGTVAVLEGGARELTLDGEDLETGLAQARADGRWQDPTVRVEDVLTGEVRAEETLVVRAEDLAPCGTGTSRDRVFVNPSLWAWGFAVRLDVCGRSVTVTPDGERHEAMRVPSVDGGFLEYTADESTRVLDASGAEEAVVPGSVLPPPALDAPGGPRLVFVGSDRLSAVDDAGERLWTIDVAGFPRYLARAGGTAVLAMVPENRVQAVDLDTGEIRWTRDDVVTTEQGGVGAAATDGEIVLVTVSGGPQTDLVALDLADGRTRWNQAYDARYGQVTVIDGRVVLADAMGGGYIRTVDGVQVETSDAALVGLAN
ncbi:PQQ-binding-like beta-propeller repeat protein [Isoptericola sp. AK164]|uniref:outer membrane protein assembly factor BamB family protein n=1 Tax=Isoptericola sp. AK164 TaxID=3024246 RepID=UPI0024189FBB|nr:PQQ-binding-like beta-propeller repeat protein [Isoptericola sp. AK164]